MGGPASAAARRRLGRARLLRFGVNYKVAVAAASKAGAQSPAAQRRCPAPRRAPRRGRFTLAFFLSLAEWHLVHALPVTCAIWSNGSPMARFLRLCTWLLALGSCLLATVQAECSQDCAKCSYRLVRPGDINFLACTLECEGQLPSFKIWETCKDLLQVSRPEFPWDNIDMYKDSSKQDESHLLAKKYGGFMKRYGGFMKKMDEP